jgi:hypothetical protein
MDMQRAHFLDRDLFPDVAFCRIQMHNLLLLLPFDCRSFGQLLFLLWQRYIGRVLELYLKLCCACTVSNICLYGLCSEFFSRHETFSQGVTVTLWLRIVETFFPRIGTWGR